MQRVLVLLARVEEAARGRGHEPLVWVCEEEVRVEFGEIEIDDSDAVRCVNDTDYIVLAAQLDEFFGRVDERGEARDELE